MSSLYAARVRYILTTLLSSLHGYTHRQFNWCEIGFLDEWWNSDATPEEQSAFRGLVERNAIVFVGGGWVENDEGVTNWMAMVNQMTLGHFWIRNTMGNVKYVPNTSWQIDCFGHTGAQARLFHEMGLQGHVIGRVDFPLKAAWRQSRSLEFVWGDMFTHTLAEHYSSPPNFDFEGFEFSYPMQNAPVTQSNVPARSQEYLNVTRQLASYYRTPNVLVPFGDDLRYVNAVKMYLNQDLINAHLASASNNNVTVKYGAIDHYVSAVLASNTTFPTTLSYKQDLLPYRRFSYTQFYTGYYTTRPLLKGAIQAHDAALHQAEVLQATHVLGGGGVDGNVSTGIASARRVSAIMTHHDAVTGTASNATVDDYMGMLQSSASVALDAARLLFGPVQSNISQVPCRIAVYNALGWTLPAMVACLSSAVPVESLQVFDSFGAAVPSQIVDGRLCFVARNVSAAGFVLFDVKKSAAPHAAPAWRPVPSRGGPLMLKNSRIACEFDPGSGKLISINGIALRVSAKSFNTSNVPNNEMSNRYFFIANSTDVGGAGTNDIPPFLPTASVRYGAIFDEVQSVVDARNLSITYRVYHDAAVGNASSVLLSYVHINATVGPFMAWNQDIALVASWPQGNASLTLETDSNGLWMVPRPINYSFAIGGQTWPATSRIVVREQKTGNRTLRVLVDRPHGVRLSPVGDVQIMQHRRLNCTNSVVLNEPLNDTSRVEVLHAFSFEDDRGMGDSYIFRSPPLVVVLQQDGAAASRLSSSSPPMLRDLPPEIHLASLQCYVESGSCFLRLHNWSSRAISFRVDRVFPFSLQPRQLNLLQPTTRGTIKNGTLVMQPDDIFSYEIAS